MQASGSRAVSKKRLNPTPVSADSGSENDSNKKIPIPPGSAGDNYVLRTEMRLDSEDKKPIYNHIRVSMAFGHSAHILTKKCSVLFGNSALELVSILMCRMERMILLSLAKSSKWYVGVSLKSNINKFELCI